MYIFKQLWLKNMLTLALIVVLVAIAHFLYEDTKMARDKATIESIQKTNEDSADDAYYACIAKARGDFFLNFKTFCSTNDKMNNVPCDSITVDLAEQYGVYIAASSPSNPFAKLYTSYKSESQKCEANLEY